MLSRDVKTAQEWAERLHQGQADKSGKPYIRHPARVAGRLQTPEAQVVGWLHDTVEDTGLSLSEVEKEFGIETAKAVDAVSRKDGEDWDAYLLRVKKNPIARQVKISDLIDNSNLSRLDHITIKDVLRQAKYNRALQLLLSENKLD
ncbi:MAG: HD domain-containing protein [Clostridia bacterium]|nr:HD domain-containing protein [Clostridia bacterium]